MPTASASSPAALPRGTSVGGVTPDKPFVASMGIYVFSRDVLLEILDQPGIDFGKEIIVDKNARIGDGVRLVNAGGTQEADGDGYYIRNGIIVVPKGAEVKSGVSA